MNVNKKLHEEFNSLRTEAVALVEKAKSENRDFSVEEKSANDTRFARMEVIKNQLDTEKKFAQLQIDALPIEMVTAVHSDPVTKVEAKADDKFAAAKKELNQFIKSGESDKYTVISTTGSSAMLPVSIAPPYLSRKPRNAFRLALAAYGIAPMVTPNTDAVNIPVWDDSSNTGNALSESASSADNQDSTDTAVTLSPVLTSSRATWFSNTLVNAVGFDIFSYAEPQLMFRIDNKQEAVWAAKFIADTSIVGKTTSAHNAITYAEVVAWYYSLGVQYRGDGVFIISDTLQQLLVGLVDTTGRPIFVPTLTGLAGEIPGTLLGKPCFVCAGLETADTAAHIVGIFMSASSLFVRDAGDRRITRYAAYPAYPDQTGLEIFVNGDANYATFATKTLKMGAS